MRKINVFCIMIVVVLLLAACSGPQASAPAHSDKISSLITKDLDAVADALGYSESDFTYDSFYGSYRLNKEVSAMGDDYALHLHFYERKEGKCLLSVTYMRSVNCTAKKAAQEAIDLRTKLLGLYGEPYLSSGSSNELNLYDATADALAQHFTENAVNSRGIRWELEKAPGNLPEYLEKLYNPACLSLKYWVDYTQEDSGGKAIIQLVYSLDSGSVSDR